MKKTIGMLFIAPLLLGCTVKTSQPQCGPEGCCPEGSCHLPVPAVNHPKPSGPWDKDDTKIPGPIK